MNTEKVTRVEVIDDKGRSYVNRNEYNKVTLSLQDNDKTFKVFIQKTNFEVGKWYTNNESCYICYQGTDTAYGFGIVGNWTNDFSTGNSFKNFVLADMDKVKELLLQEAKRRFPIGSKIKSMTNNSTHIINYYNIRFNTKNPPHVGFSNKSIICGAINNIDPNWMDCVLYEDGKWAEIIEEPKYEPKSNVVEVPIPDGYEVGDIQNYGGHMKRTTIMWQAKNPMVSCKECIKAGKCIVTPYNFTSVNCSSYQSKQDLSNTKIWIGDNPKLSELVYNKLTELGYHHNMGDFTTYIKNRWVIIINKNEQVSWWSKDTLDLSNYTEITPQDLDIAKEEYEVKLVTEDNVNLYKGDKCWNVSKRLSLNYALCVYDKEYKYFSTKEAAEKYIKDNEFKVGDLVVVLPEDDYYYNCEKGKAQKIYKTYDQKLKYGLKFKDGSTNAYAKVRKATQVEIDEYLYEEELTNLKQKYNKV